MVHANPSCDSTAEPPRARSGGRLPALLTWVGPVVLLGSTAALPAEAAGGQHPPDAEATAPARRAGIAVVTTPAGAWPDAAETIAFELDQAGYRVVSDGVQASTTLTVSRGDQGWTLVLVDATRSIVLHATGRDAESPQIVGLHAVELVHTSRLDVPKQRRQDPTPTPRRPAPVQHTPPTQPRTAWAFDLGVAVSSIGLVGPRVGLARHWPRAELGVSFEAAFGAAGNVQYPASRDMWPYRGPRVVGRSTLELAYVTRPGRRFRPLIGLSNDLIAPAIASSYEEAEPRLDLDTVDVGVFWVPGLDVGARLVVGPSVAVRAALRAGPMVTLRPVDLAGGGTFRLPPAAAMGTLSVLFGRTGQSPGIR